MTDKQPTIEDRLYQAKIVEESWGNIGEVKPAFNETEIQQILDALQTVERLDNHIENLKCFIQNEPNTTFVGSDILQQCKIIRSGKNETFKMKLPSTSGTIREVAKNYRGKQYPWWKFW